MNVGAPASPPDDALARAFTIQNTDLEAPPVSESLARAFTLQNTDLEAPPLTESVARAFTVNQVGETFAPPPEEAFARAVTLQNLGIAEDPEMEEVIGRAFTVQNTGEVVDVPITPRVVLPATFQLYANAPNPFRRSTSIRYDLPRASAISIRLYDVSGRLVKVLVHSKKHEPGRFVVDWNGLDQDGRALSSGIYFYRMRAGSFDESRRVFLIRN
jgi:hypothetical protein